jgi:endonuclease YncB( thermonuclease family)
LKKNEQAGPGSRAIALRVSIALVVLFASLLATSVTRAATLRADVLFVDDGDSMVLRDEAGTRYKLRLDGIDAPERHQAFHRQARSHLSQLLLNQPVTVEWHKQDRYGRLVGKLSVGGRDAGLAQLHAGMAWHYRAYAAGQSRRDRNRYAAAEARARAKGIGLWQHPAPTPPWEFRRQQGPR